MVAVNVTKFADCISAMEKKERLMSMLVTGVIAFVWLLFVVVTWGILLVLTGLAWVVSLLTAEYNVRKIQAMGATVSPSQFPEIYAAAEQVCRRFGVPNEHRIIVVAQSSVNALAIRFAKKKVIVLFSEAVEGILDRPAQLRALLAHEMCHSALDHGPRRFMELYKSARFQQGRELTCDNAGVVAAESISETREVIKKLCVGNRLASRLSEETLVREAAEIESGLVGWVLKGKLTHPPAGRRLQNVTEFGRSVGVPEMAELGVVGGTGPAVGVLPGALGELSPTGCEGGGGRLDGGAGG